MTGTLFSLFLKKDIFEYHNQLKMIAILIKNKERTRFIDNNDIFLR